MLITKNQVQAAIPISGGITTSGDTNVWKLNIIGVVRIAFQISSAKKEHSPDVNLISMVIKLISFWIEIA